MTEMEDHFRRYRKRRVLSGAGEGLAAKAQGVMPIVRR